MGTKKITASLHFGLHPMQITSTGIKFNDDFMERLYDTEEYFREKIILKINDIAGNDWAVRFVEEPTENKSYLVDVEVKEDRHLLKIINIIAEAFPEINLSFWKPGIQYQHLGSRKAVA